MIGSECDIINQTLTSLLRDRLGERLFAIIATGSIASGAFTPHWSDIDLLVIVDSLDIETKRRLASAARAIQDKFETHCGLNVLTTLEATLPILPLQMMEGKILQTLLEAHRWPQRILYPRENESVSFFCPSENLIRQYSILNIGRLLAMHRVTVSRQQYEDVHDLKRVAAKTIRLGFIISKLAVQYFALHVCESNEETVERVVQMFGEIDCTPLARNLDAIVRWQTIDHLELITVVDTTDLFIEDFVQYVLNNAKGE